MSLVTLFQDEACKTNTTHNQPHQSSNTQRTENKATDVVIQQHSRKAPDDGYINVRKRVEHIRSETK
jgi:hypothetical protein